MSYTILSARYANSEHTAAEILTAESAAVMISELDKPEAWAEFKEWEKANSVAAFEQPPAVAKEPTTRDVLAALKAKGIEITEADIARVKP